jgi:peptidoglycan/LPS O-acetylase OafA/YrhL
VGVDIFFALSGFLITSILLKTNYENLYGYYVRRFFRIAPVYYLTLGLTIASVFILKSFGLGESKFDQLGDMLIPSLLFSRELSNAPTLFGQAWTVGIEEKFYLFWPLVFLFIKNTKNLIIFLVLAFGFCILFLKSSMLLRGYGGISLGCISSLLYFKKKIRIKTIYSSFALLLAYIICYFVDFSWKNILISFAGSMLVVSLYSEKTKLSNMLSGKLIVSIGKLTFSVYMIHNLILNMVKFSLSQTPINQWYYIFGLGYIFSLLISWVIYKYFEYPLIKFASKFK